MIDVQRPLSVILAALLLKEFPREYLVAQGCATLPGGQVTMERFYLGFGGTSP